MAQPASVLAPAPSECLCLHRSPHTLRASGKMMPETLPIALLILPDCFASLLFLLRS